MLCSNPKQTNVINGNQMPRNFPPNVVAALQQNTETVTNMLQIIANNTKFPKVFVVLATDMFCMYLIQ